MFRVTDLEHKTNKIRALIFIKDKLSYPKKKFMKNKPTELEMLVVDLIALDKEILEEEANLKYLHGLRQDVLKKLEEEKRKATLRVIK